jgi:class 3 adenylate cyclase
MDIHNLDDGTTAEDVGKAHAKDMDVQLKYGVKASFISAAGTVRCAIQIRRELEKHAQKDSEHALKVRVGAAVGEPVEQNNDLFGSTVQLAARLCAHAQPGQILVSNAIAELCLGKGFSFEDLGEVTLNGFNSPVRAHAAPWKQ